MNRKEINIIGAGISGLTAAINLALNDFDVTVIERRETIGSKSKGDFQGLENWTSSKDILEFLNQININIDFEYEPFKECYWFDSHLKKYTIKSNEVGFYLIRRGPMEGTLDYSLAKTARQAGVNIRPSNNNEKGCDIIATGSKDAFIIAAGVNFNTDLEKVAMAIFDDSIAPMGYSYLLGLRGRGTIAVVSRVGVKHLHHYLERAINRFGEILNFQIHDPIKFGGHGTYFTTLGTGNPKVGEAGGFQDAMWGFGLRMAFQTGYLAAKALSEGLDYWQLVKKEVVPLCRSSVVNRLFYDLIGSKRYKFLLTRFSRAEDPVIYANELYSSNLLKHILFPLAKRIIKGKRFSQQITRGIGLK